VTRRDLAAVAGIAVGAALLFGLIVARPLDELGIDCLFWLRQTFLPASHPAGDAPVVVIGIDEETYRREPFKDTPQVMWTPQVGKVLDAVLEGGATVVGFDVVYSTSIESFAPGFERDFLRSLRRGSDQGRIVLGELQHQLQPIVPYRGYIVAAREENLRDLNVDEDSDGIVRRVPLFLDFVGADQKVSSETAFAFELAARGLGKKPTRDADGTVRLGDAAVRTASPSALGVNFDTAPGAVPTYSFADLAKCAENGSADYFKKHFAGRIVLVGTVLDSEDRKLTSMRLATSPEGLNAPERCALTPIANPFRADFRRDSIPGVFIHAAAIANLTRGDALVPLARPLALALLIALALAVGVAVMQLRLIAAAAAASAMAVVWTAASVGAFTSAAVLPLLSGIAAAATAFAGNLGYRFGVTDRNRRRLAKFFALYLPPSEVDRLVSADPKLGGEARTVSILFTDLASFAGVSEYLDPAELAAALNTYFAAVTEIVERHHGIVDKFIGDAVVAVFGAPLPDPDHALHAVQAAIAIRSASNEAARALARPGERPPATRIGVNTGPALVGNIGSPRRFNYTVMGDSVNLASRVEGVNKRYGTLALVTDSTAAACGDAIVFREIDIVAVKGRERPVTLYEPLWAAGEVPDDALTRRAEFGSALRLWRAGSFEAAAAAFEALADADPASARFAVLARDFAAEPPADWVGISVLTEK